VRTTRPTLDRGTDTVADAGAARGREPQGGARPVLVRYVRRTTVLCHTQWFGVYVRISLAEAGAPGGPGARLGAAGRHGWSVSGSRRSGRSDLGGRILAVGDTAWRAPAVGDGARASRPTARRAARGPSRGPPQRADPEGAGGADGRCRDAAGWPRHGTAKTVRGRSPGGDAGADAWARRRQDDANTNADRTTRRASRRQDDAAGDASPSRGGQRAGETAGGPVASRAGAAASCHRGPRSSREPREPHGSCGRRCAPDACGPASRGAGRGPCSPWNDIMCIIGTLETRC
jgi:hypothetical protein